MSDYNENSPFTENEKREKNYNEKKKFDPSMYLNTRLAENEDARDVHIRILPATPTTAKISTDIHIHSMKVSPDIARSGFKAFTCLKDSHLAEQDPRGCPFCNEFDAYCQRATAMKREKEAAGINLKMDPEYKALWKEAFKFQPKIAHIVRVIDRDHEDEGVKFWRFNEWDNGKGSYDYLKAIYKAYNENAASSQFQAEFKRRPKKEELEEYMKDENGKIREFYNVFDLENGHDIVLTLTRGETTKDRTEIKIMADVAATPLSDDPKQVKEWINDSKTWNDAYAVKTYEYLDIILNGGIPVFDRSKNIFVSKEEKEQADQQATAEAVKAASQESGQMSMPLDDDLPF